MSTLSPLKSFPATCAPEMRLAHQRAVRWWAKQFLRSAGRPEIPQDFRPAKNSHALKHRKDVSTQMRRKAASADFRRKFFSR
jgi:hypothetical protein